MIARGMRTALKRAGILLRWEGPAGVVEFKAVKNPMPVAKDGIQLNTGANSPCTLDTLVEKFQGAAGVTLLPGQEETFTGADDGLLYRVSGVDHVLGYPVVRFIIAAIVPATAPAPSP